MQRIRLVLEYDGAEFAGWQLQPGQRTVQGVVEKAAARIVATTERVVVEASGRTDAGVHARAQVVALDDPHDRPLSAWQQGLRAELPDDVMVVDASIVAANFNPRRDSTGKRYVYRIWNGPHRRPLLRRQVWFRFGPLDLEAMRAAARLLEGEHDFESFRAARCSANTTVRHLTRLEVQGASGEEVRVIAEGNGFLRHMVRNLVGALVEVAEGRRTLESLEAILAARDRAAAGLSAPPQGLTLDAVYYGADQASE